MVLRYAGRAKGLGRRERFTALAHGWGRVTWVAALLCACGLWVGCAATQVALEKKDLKVQTQMSDTIFLDLENQIERTVFVDIRNTSDHDIDIAPMVRQQLEDKGYRVVSTPAKAFYILQANVLYVGKADPSALRTALGAGFGGPLGGAVAGGLIGGAAKGSSGAWLGAGVGGLVGGAAELVGGSLVKDVTYTIVTDIQISEKSGEVVQQTVKSNLAQGSRSQVLQTSSSTRSRRKYQTRVVSTANKVNLKLEEAQIPLMVGLARSVAGIF